MERSSIRELGHDPTRGQFVDYDYVNQFQMATTGQYGAYPNAEEMISAHRASRDPALARAQITVPNEEATAEAREDMEGTTSSFDLGEGEKLLDVTVRGDAMIGIVRAKSGAWRKQIVAANDRYEAPPEAEASKASREADQARSETMAKAAQLREDAAKKLAEAQEKIQTELSEKVAALNEEAAEEAAQQSESQSSEPRPQAQPARSTQQQPRRS